MSEFEIIQLRARVAELEDKLEKVYRHLGLTYDANAPAEDPRLIAYIRQGNMLEAIKVYREIYNVGLAEAKAAIEQMRGRL
jgi:ribosomal protein L7/L12